MKYVVVIVCLVVMTACAKREESAPAPVAETKPQPTEFADPKFVDIGKKALADLNANNLDGFMTNFSENSRYYFSAGDSLIGKAAISAFWKDRFSSLVESAQFYDDIWTPLKVNVSQSRSDLPGVWLLCWYRVNVTYKNGAKLNYAVHTDFHFDGSDKIDLTVLYMDRAPIVAALAKK
ncbi:hypothetical protein WBG78_14110 [Chryseolinea sp. T2]|uniref:hypothetical protein n=1 Tax=Chryseolinea sp. T2 TaxID=3129255 RepID=UPI00307762E7